MKKFERLNKLTNVKEQYIGVSGKIVSFGENPIANKTSGKMFHRFTAEIDTPSGKTTIGGQVYEALLPFLSGTPSVGDKLDFSARVEDLKSGKNAYWGISGQAVDAVSDDFLDAIASL
jgi:hypothetical protein